MAGAQSTPTRRLWYAAKVSAQRPASPEELRRRVEGWRAAEQRERALRSAEGPLDPEAAVAAALELSALDPDPSANDAQRIAGVEAARAAWQKLREAFGWRPGAAEHG